jgi:uncharacterized protein
VPARTGLFVFRCSRAPFISILLPCTFLESRMAEDILIGKGEFEQRLVLKRGNRHGLIAGATGTGKTVTLQVLAEGFARSGVPVFMADVKGDLSGMAMPGSPTHKAHEVLAARAAQMGITDWVYADNNVVFWDLFGEQGHPIRTTVSEMGPLLLARLMGLNDTQEGVLAIAFRYADDEGLLLLDLKDLQEMLIYVSENAEALTARYGNVAKATVGAIQRQLLQLDSQGGDKFFGEPALDIADLIQTDESGRGQISILAADKLMASPKLYSTFLLWLMSELFETLPEVGDPDKPIMVFFFDEAHLLFNEAPKALLEKIEQVVRLIRSKGVGVYFISQNPIDIPETVAGQLGNRVQHALRAFTPRDQKAVKAAAETFRQNPKINVETAITELAVGEALVSLLQLDGTPSIVDRALVRPPCSRLGPVLPNERTMILKTSIVAGKYEEVIDRESAYEILNARNSAEDAQEAEDKAAADQAKIDAKAQKEAIARERQAARPAPRAAQSMGAKMATSAARSVASSMGRQVATEIGKQVFGKKGGGLLRGLLGALLK